MTCCSASPQWAALGFVSALAAMHACGNDDGSNAEIRGGAGGESGEHGDTYGTGSGLGGAGGTSAAAGGTSAGGVSAGFGGGITSGTELSPASPQRVEFATSDGQTLVGYYFPAAQTSAPIVVLMHWGRGDQTDWIYVGMVSWLQNRGSAVPSAPNVRPFDTPYAFVPLPKERSYGVFTFDFRTYGESAAAKGTDADHILDAEAAYAKAATLPGADASRIVGIGASIGADAAAEGCNAACRGALSLGPADWLGASYVQAVTTMDAAGKPAWCIAAEDAPKDHTTCQGADGVYHRERLYPKGGHAMQLFRQSVEVSPSLQTEILEFLESVVP